MLREKVRKHAFDQEKDKIQEKRKETRFRLRTKKENTLTTKKKKLETKI